MEKKRETPKFCLSRRNLLKSAGALGLASALPHARPASAEDALSFELTAATGRRNLVGAPHPDTDVWCYNGAIPGPEIRVRQGERVRIRVTNALAEETTIHWHGIRVPNAMDGVPHVTQQPIAPGKDFIYEFTAPDAGTYWYHPHQRSFEQVGRGLSGAFIVEERDAVAVDRDIIWVLDDWRLLPTAQISNDFGNMHDATHNGRVGNTVTINGRVPDRFPVHAGERVRLRLINAANARIFGLRFQGHRPWIVALDGQPVAPHRPQEDQVVLGPAMRIDLILDMIGAPGESHQVIDAFYPNLAYRLVDLAYAQSPAIRRIGQDPPTLPANPLQEPDARNAVRHEVVFGGGMMGRMRGGMMGGRMMRMGDMMRNGMAWTINGVAASGHAHDPLATLELGRTHLLAMDNRTAWHHPMHLHGHSFRVIARNGLPTERREWQDTVLMEPDERVDIAFVADNPGDWMFHCHILEHQAAGMMGLFRVA